MKIINTQKGLNDYLASLPSSNSLGFVPTMGALHAGHLSLLEQAKKQDDTVICSVFVNPTQFNEKSDFDSYPKVLDEDLKLLEKVDTDAVFAPSVEQIYPNGTEALPFYDIGVLDNILEGEHRPGHFQGVCHIIETFLNLLKPKHIYMGEKDFQQIAVVQCLLDLKNHKTVLVPCATLREESGLAMSSRNMRLSQEGKIKAATFYKALCHIRDHADNVKFEVLKKEAEQMLIENDFTPEYIALCNASNLTEIKDFDHDKTMRLIAAAFIEEVRLIDNIGI
jgi:pantoate--beta-alanine ligase